MKNMESRILNEINRLRRVKKRCNEIQRELKILETEAIKGIKR